MIRDFFRYTAALYLSTLSRARLTVSLISIPEIKSALVSICAPTFAMSRRLLCWISSVLAEVQSLSTATLYSREMPS